jgi:hypothetical protein
MLSAAVLADVVSVNVVGFININVPANGYALVANQLNASPNNQIGNVIPTAPGGTRVFRWDVANQQLFDAIEYVDQVGWVEGEAISTALLDPGAGFYIQNPGAAAITVTLVGEVPQGTGLTVQLAQNYSMVSSIVPQSLGLMSMGFPTPTGAGVQYYSFDTVKQQLNDAIEYVPQVGWVKGEEISEPVPAVGEGFFINNPLAPMTWTRDFTVQ